MRWSSLFILKVVISWILLLASVLYTMAGISQHYSWSSNNLHIKFLEVVLTTMFLVGAIYILGFFEAGQVGASRLATLSPHEFNSEAQLVQQATRGDNKIHNKYSTLTFSYISEPRGFERYLVCSNGDLCKHCVTATYTWGGHIYVCGIMSYSLYICNNIPVVWRVTFIHFYILFARSDDSWL